MSHELQVHSTFTTFSPQVCQTLDFLNSSFGNIFLSFLFFWPYFYFLFPRLGLNFHPVSVVSSSSPRERGCRVGPEMKSLFPLAVCCISLVSLQQLLALPAEERPNRNRYDPVYWGYYFTTHHIPASHWLNRTL